MLYCNETVTLVRLVNGATYSSVKITGCSWKDQTDGTVGDRGIMVAQSYAIRIPADSVPAIMPAVGDYIIRGEGPATITSIKDLSGYRYGKIMTVGDNRRGHLPHVKVVAG